MDLFICCCWILTVKELSNSISTLRCSVATSDFPWWLCDGCSKMVMMVYWSLTRSVCKSPTARTSRPTERTYVETIEHEQFVQVIWNSRRVVLLNADVVFIGFRGLMMSKRPQIKILWEWFNNPYGASLHFIKGWPLFISLRLSWL